MITRQATKAALSAAAAGASTADALTIAAEVDARLRAIATEARTSELGRPRLEALELDPPLAGAILAMPSGVPRMRAAELVLSALAMKPEKRGILGAIALLIVTSVLLQILVVMASTAKISEQLETPAVPIALALVALAHVLALGALALRLERAPVRTLALAAFVPWLMPVTLMTAGERNRRRGISRAGVLRCLAAGELAGLGHAETARRLLPSFGGRAAGLDLEGLASADGRRLDEALVRWAGRRSAVRALGATPLVGESQADALVRLARLTTIERAARTAELVSWAAASCVVLAVFTATNGVLGTALQVAETIAR
jgi:hypothetical protein